MFGHRFPAVVPDASVPIHLEILRFLTRLHSRSVESVREAGTVNGNLPPSAKDLGRVDAADLKDCRSNIGDVMELMPYRPMIRHACGPRDDKWITYAPAMGIALVQAKGRVTRLCPTPRIK